MEILVWFILSYGLMNIMVFGSIFQGLRDSFKKWGENKLMRFNEVGEFISGILSVQCVLVLGEVLHFHYWYFHRLSHYLEHLFGLVGSLMVYYRQGPCGR